MATRQQQPQETRVSLLSAAKRVLGQKGKNLSLDLVAHEAGVSKGGLLHHFPTRTDLLLALQSYLLTGFSVSLDTVAQELAAREGSHRPGVWLRAYIELSFRFDQEDRAAYAMLALLLDAEGAPRAATDAFAHVVTRCEQDGIPVERAHIVRLACDALWLSQNFAMGGLPPETLAKIRTNLLSMTQVD